MSQSPDQPGIVRANYVGAWAALSSLVAGGGSFSGGERNCVFINDHGKGFVDAGAVLELDHPEDGRAVLNTDWNFDGWPDFWIANRTGPRLRCMVNRLRQTGLKGGFIALRLTGRNGNRDAVGTRVEIHDAQNAVLLTKTAQSGSGFLSQSSRWLHFGLGEANRVEKVLVHWAGGSEQLVGPLESNKFYDLREGDLPQEWIPPTMHLPSEAPKSQDSSSDNSSELWLAMRLPLPSAPWIPQDSKSPSPLGEIIDQPWALSLWSSTCMPCQREWKQWNAATQRIEQSGLRVRLVSVDALEHPGKRGGLPDDLATPFEGGYATEELIDSLELFQRSQMEWQTPLPVPSTFLLDTNNRVAAIFRGGLSAEDLLNAAKQLDQSAGVPHRDQSVPFPGRWVTPAPLPDPTVVARTMAWAGESDMAFRYLNQFQDNHDRYFRGENITPLDRDRVIAAAITFQNQLATETDPRFQPLAGNRAERIQSLEKLANKSGTVETQRVLAWLYLEPGVSGRDPSRGLELARKACQQNGYRDPASLLLLAYAYGVGGDYEKAAETAGLAHEKILDQPRQVPLFQSALDAFREEKLPDLPQSLFVPKK